MLVYVSVYVHTLKGKKKVKFNYSLREIEKLNLDQGFLKQVIWSP